MQQAGAAAMLAAGLIPVFGWVGKGGVAIYKTTKAVNATTAVFDMYKTTKSLQVIKNTEYGIYGLISANGFSEYLTGKDILGNALTTSQRQASLSLGLAGILPTAIELTPASKAVTKDITKKAHERVVRNTQSARSFVDHWFNGLVSQTDVAMAGGPRLPINAMRDTHVQQEIHTSFAKVTKGKGSLDKTYKRPSGYRKGVRDEVWEKAKDTDGNVRDPLTGTLMNKDGPWDMGHKPGYEFRKHQQSAMERGISRKEFLDEHNNPDHYYPELPSSNRSHKGEDLTDDYFGD
ncbi:HNH/ENDO VII family nuclease [Paraliobacillus sp. JSM ZJ581]|uniref:HNH/ENDO VII family nuclease n=1 Tax=Paraliobacillus sp. JSM ZJ581 TaxID=3342118 RepID=UPI0035A872C4